MEKKERCAREDVLNGLYVNYLFGFTILKLTMLAAVVVLFKLLVEDAI